MPRKQPTFSGLRFITPAALRRLVRNNRGAFLPAQILFLVDANADSEGRITLRRTEVCANLGCRPKSATEAVQWLKRNGLVRIESPRGEPWVFRILPVPESAEATFVLPN